jgi:hypothetical protein
MPTRTRRVAPVPFRVICHLCAFFFLAMGILLVGFPEIATRAAGEQSPVVHGMLRGAGGSLLPYCLLYVLVAADPVSRRWGVVVIALGNAVAITLDLLSVHLGEYRLAWAMFDLPVETVSLAAMSWSLAVHRSNDSAA